MPVTNLDFHLLKDNDRFRLEIHRRGDSNLLASANLDFPNWLLSGFELRQLDFQAKDPEERLNRLRDYGGRLYQTIFTPDVVHIWSEHKRDNDFSCLCIRIASQVNELEAIPWETLFDGEEFIAAGIRTTISRLPLDVAPQAALPAVPLPLKMLALVSSPIDLVDNARLQMELEQEILLEAINDPAGQGRLRVDFEDEAKLEILESSLETPYQIFHFTGHGIGPEQGGGLLLEDSRGNGVAASVNDVVTSLRVGERHLRLVVLSGCQTARTLNVAGFRDMARGLLRHGVPSVIAMQFSISDTGGLKFAEVFYPRLASGRALELASHAARRALILSDDPYLKADALAAVLLTANGDCLQTTQAEAAPQSELPKIDFSFFLPLPQLSHGFYGRRREYRQIRDAILQRNQRAVIVHGIGGIGKTALISHVATRMRKRFQGIYAFDCSSGTLTPETVVIKLNEYFTDQGVKGLEQLLYRNLSPDKLANYLGQILSQWSLLLIFDNFESQLERSGDSFEIADENLRIFISTLVKATATNSHFLFTSRYLFEIDERRLGSIQTLALQDLSPPEALSLMQKLQHLAEASYAEKLKVLDIFGGHPYALVTLDRYCNQQPLAEALNAAQNIHTALREFLAIELNYGQLSERSRELLNGLAAFRQSVPYQAAEWVLGQTVPLSPELMENLQSVFLAQFPEVDEAQFTELVENVLPEHRMADDLTGSIRELVDWGLLTPIEADGKLRVLVHALVRDFCRDKQASETWHHHLRDAAAFYINPTKLTLKEEKSQAAVWTEMEAFELLMEAADFYDAAKLLVGITELLDRWGFGQYLESQYRRLLKKLDSEGTAVILHNLGRLVEARGDYEQALKCYESSLAIKEELGDRQGAAISLHQIGIIHLLRGDYNQAMKCYERSLEIFKEVGHRDGVANSLHQIGMVREDLGDYDQALRFYEQSLKIHQELGNPSRIANALHQIGNVQFELGNSDEALQYYERSLKIKEELDNRSGIGRSFHQIGIVHQMTGDYERAMEYYERSLKIAKELDDRSGVASSHAQIGKLMMHLGRYDEAFRNILIALRLALELQSPDAQIAIDDLKKLREKWGNENFDRAWKEATDTEVPDWLKEKARPSRGVPEDGEEVEDRAGDYE